VATILNLTSGIVYLKSFSGTLSGTNITLSGATGVTFSTAGSAGVGPFSTTGTALKGADGGNYFYVTNGAVTVNSASLQLANGGTAKFSFPAASATDGQMQFNNGAGSSGVGVDVATDGTIKIRNRSFTAATGNLDIGAKITAYNGVTTAGWGVSAVYAAGRATAQSAANASIATYTVGAADGSFEVSFNMNVTASTTLSTSGFCTYTDESNTARTMLFPIQTTTGSFVALGAITGAGASVWHSPVMHIRCKAATAITIGTSAGTFTGITYTAEGIIRQVA